MATLRQKVSISLNSALLFAFINLPQTYQFTNNLTNQQLFNTTTNCPTNLGLIVHAIAFFVITFLSMGCSTKNVGIKLKHTLYGTLIFYLVSSPALYSAVGSVLGRQFADINGCPTLAGIGLHSAVYFAILVGVMYLPERNR
jgi:hypothetical protein